MKIVKIQEKELNEARELQKKCVDLHLPVPPVVSWNATIIDKDGVEKEQIIAKANSYVRNALNLLARYIGMASPSIVNTNTFKDGLINIKTTDGMIAAANISTSIGFIMSLGDKTSPTSESIDHYQDISTTGSWTTAGNLHYSDFIQESRKLITQFVIVRVNTSKDIQYITEACIYGSTNVYFLLLRDVFTPIAVLPGESIRFVYQTEVLFPLA